MTATNSSGRIITFYSYKGGTGRSMALANVAWTLASNGKRVLVIDWDLEAPGLHRYFTPFLLDTELVSSEGVIDFVIDFAVNALTPLQSSESNGKVFQEWYISYANILRYATSLIWKFPRSGTLDFVPAGRQSPSYSARVNSFDWLNFYERLGGSAFLEAAKNIMRAEYDYILIDSRTGVSDTSGICTVQMPDILVVCYTLNNQSIDGASAVAASVCKQRNDPAVLVFPVAMRVDLFEKRKLEMRKAYAKEKFAFAVNQLSKKQRELYQEVEFPYVPFYAYEEILATFGDRPEETTSLLVSTERLTSLITNGDVRNLIPPTEQEREKILALYEGKSLPRIVPPNTNIERLASLMTQGNEEDLHLPSEQEHPKFPELPESRSLQGVAHPLPHIPRPPTIGYVVRHDKDGSEIVARLQDELAPEKNQLVVLWGDGGVGKTTIAAEAVRRMSGLFAGRIAWTSADGRQDYSLSTLLDEIASQLGQAELRKLALEPKKEAVRALIASLDGSALVVLDNFETISPAEQKHCAEWLMQHAPCPALITTRQRVSGPRNLSIDVMSSAEAHEYLDKLIAQTANPRTFADIDRNRIIQAADANPHVMQWVIGQIELAQHPNDVLDELAQGGGDAAVRVFDRSFNLPQLSDDGRDSLLALSLFVPSASRIALAAIAGFNNDVKRLHQAVKHLAALRLVETTDTGERLIIKGLIRSLARARLAEDPRADEFRRPFIAYFLSYAQLHSKTTPEDFAALEVERENVLTAMDLAYELMDWQSVIGLMDAIGDPVNGFLSLHGYWYEAIRRGEQTIEAARAIKDELLIAILTVNLANIRQNRGEYEQARNLYEQTLKVFEKVGSTENVAIALHQLGTIAQDQGELDKAHRLYSESLEIKKQLGDLSGIAMSLHRLGMLAQERGELNETRRFYDESRKIEMKLGNQSGIAITLHELGRLAQDQGEIEEARRLYNDSLEIKKRLGDQNGIAITLHQLAILAQVQGEIEGARRLYNDSLEIAKRLGNQSGIASTLYQLGRLAEDGDNYTEAARLFREALSIFEKLKSPNAAIVRQSLERVQSKA